MPAPSSRSPVPLQPPRLVLASTSARREQLLRDAGYRFETTAPSVEEPPLAGATVKPEALAVALAFFKAGSVADRFPGCTILGVDTLASVDDEIIGKPADRDDARRILRRLSGTTHRVITGVALLDPAGGRRLLRSDATTVHVRKLADDEIEQYLETGEWQGKAGAYGVQDVGDRFVERLDGSFTNVVGLPMELLARMFAEWLDGWS